MEKWMADIVGELHFRRITQRKLAKQLGVTEEYVSSILNGKIDKVPDGMKQRMEDAIKEIVFGVTVNDLKKGELL